MSPEPEEVQMFVFFGSEEAAHLAIDAMELNGHSMLVNNPHDFSGYVRGTLESRSSVSALIHHVTSAMSGNLGSVTREALERQYWR